VTRWRWLNSPLVYALHDRQLSEHGGLEGVRDEGLAESALARPKNLAACGEPDLPTLAAAYAFGLSRNHGFADGNKRTAWVSARVFILDNNGTLHFEEVDAIRTMEAVAEGRMSEKELANWLRARLAAPPPSSQP
jgi:death-on-curing protein